MTRRECILALTAAPAARLESHILAGFPALRLLHSDWPEPEKPVPAGSLMKPFVALAYGAGHSFDYPEVECRRCWKPDGHGLISLERAVAFSCNTYFLQLAHACAVEDMERVAAAYSLPAPGSREPESWMGLGAGWLVPPVRLIHAYCELAARFRDPAPARVLQGMRLSSRIGTARAIGCDAFAKTGTGPCIHAREGGGDGYAIAMFPAESPSHAVLVQTHNQPGSEAARAAGRIIRRVHLA